ncbi:SWIM zinc finger family protein [Streptomyces sp. NPDC003011]
MTPGPADEARRALRAARERGQGTPTDADRSEPRPEPRPEPRAGSRSEPRPDQADERAGDRESGGGESGDREFGGGESGDVGRLAPPSHAGDADPQGRRPADVAREALRAARGEARRTRADTPPPGREAAGAPRRTTTSALSRSPRAASDRAAGPSPRERARAVRELLSDAFRMPDTAAPAEGDAGDDGTTGTLSPAAPTPTVAPDPTRPAADTPAPAHDTPEPTSGVWDPSAASAPSAPPSAPAPPVTGPAALPALPPASAPPRHPRTMAAPDRDSELRRTFPAFPPRAADGAGFAETWWGNAWVTALEEGALDAKRLARGRGYAEQGHVDAITVTPGLVLAYVQGSRARPYRVQVRLRTLDDTDWDRFLRSAAERPGDIAALLDKEMPATLADSGVPLLPGPGDLDPRCSCPDSGHPCKHAAALCYQTARLLDADPFVLLLLRGRGERELLDALSRLSAARAARAAREKGPAPLPGVRATDALAPRHLPPLPPPSPTPPHPGQPPVYPAASGGPDPMALDQLATDAAARAHALLATGRDPVGELTLWQDAVRLAAARPGSGLTAGTRTLYSSLASATGRTPADLARAVAAWRQGGLEGLTVLEETWDPPAGRFDRARPLLLAADLPAFRPWRNHLTHPRGHVQLRLGRDGLWYAYESEPGHDDWWPRGTPDLDPVGALTGLGTPDDL